MQRLAILVASVLLTGCSGGAKPRPLAPLPDDRPPAEPVAAAIAEPAVDPTVVPQGTIATVSVGTPGAMMADLGAYLTTAGFAGARPALANMAGMTGFAFDRPILALVVNGDRGPEPVLAGSVGDEQTVRTFAQMSGMTAEIRDGVVVVASDAQQASIGPHLRWRLGQPVPAELQFELASELVNMIVATASASIPSNPLAGFDSIAQLAGSVRFDANEATLKVVIAGRPGTGIEKFAASLAPSDFRLAAAVAAPGDTIFGAGTLDYRLMGEAMRGWLGPIMEMWRSVEAVTDGSTAMALREAGSMVTIVGVRDTVAAADAYEQAVRAMAAPVVFMNSSTVGRLRVRRIARTWFHELESTPTASATDEERATLRRMFGSETSSVVVGVAGKAAISAMGKRRDKAIGDVMRKLDKPGAIASPGALAAVDEARRASEAFVTTFDLPAIVAWTAPPAALPGKPPAPSPMRPLARLGLSRVGDAVGLRFVLPAQQVDVFREMAVGSP